MGQTLSEPVVDKETDHGKNDRLVYGSSCMQGWRISMEDAHTTLLQLPGDDKAALFAVFDGHGGSNVAKYAGEKMHLRIISDKSYGAGDYEAALKNGFLGIDEDMLKDPTMRNDTSGATSVVCLIKDGKIYCANAGDSRAIVSTNGRAVPLSYDHKPMNQGEVERILAAGGFVEFGRVNGNLALSRAIGDFEFKNNFYLSAEKQVVTADPDIIVKALTNEEEFMVVACDGIWDVLTNQEVCDFVRERIGKGDAIESVCEQLLDRCLAPESRMGGVGCDNMSVVIVGFLRNGDYADLCKRCDAAPVL
eukprot:Nk52_evm12s1178 gene=Nk52_evmTU12s1178